jgi:ATP-dependent DNA helicase RecG
MASNLPFELTNAQKIVLDEIKADMAKEYPMQRLLQGEVGSGKTIVALLAAAMALDGSYQVAFMAPTEILAKQHFEKISSQLSAVSNQNKKIKISLLVSSLNKKDKDNSYQEIKSGKINLVIGTHALLQEDLKFKNLGLVIIDEQHRFGVAQRASLPKKGSDPDILIMTATPIPRTLSMTLYGDLDISVIDELPKNRLPIKTFSYSQERLDEVYQFVRNIVKRRQQVYFICPVIEESEEEDLKAAQTTYREFKEDIFKEFKVGLIHGQMDSKSADKIMQDFREANIDILVATCVLEVGIDIPNATCMAVLQAERFGLAQLHQLRGRIGRGEDKSYFIVVCDPKTEESRERIKAVVELSDGSKIAEEDLRIRGPGEFFGKRQHGLTVLKIANPLTQMRLLKNARDEVIILLKNDPDLSLRQNQQLLLRIKKNFTQFPHLDIVA